MQCNVKIVEKGCYLWCRYKTRFCSLVVITIFTKFMLVNEALLNISQNNGDQISFVTCSNFMNLSVSCLGSGGTARVPCVVCSAICLCSRANCHLWKWFVRRHDEMALTFLWTYQPKHCQLLKSGVGNFLHVRKPIDCASDRHTCLIILG